MTALDWILLLVVGVSGLLGLLRGMIGVVVSLVAWLLAGLAAYLFGGDVGQGLVTDGQLGWGEYLGGYALSFAVVWIAVALVGLLVRRLAHEAGLSGVDRLFGFGLGVVRGLFFACVLLLLLGLTSIPGKRAWQESAGVALLSPVAHWMRGALPPWMAQRVDLEGRGGSLQAQVQTQAQQLKRVLPEGLPAAIPDVLSDGRLSAGALPDALPQILPPAASRKTPPADPTLVTPDPPANGPQPDAKRVH
ncbi:CvpA family protein [Lysobacter solisilvae (ex Woo and Kim 2020)]|uniref:CvpA family protein n=1 Tax=Agrilutibacter terrestris TaxID=2865112 RepID=A0A7H0FVA0_9GAMM|nr:CvpA family protein [Lysobacter terrestris]QNP39966.1 CvpA family protein [Lysobacter terrestris]